MLKNVVLYIYLRLCLEKLIKCWTGEHNGKYPSEVYDFGALDRRQFVWRGRKKQRSSLIGPRNITFQIVKMFYIELLMHVLEAVNSKL